MNSLLLDEQDRVRIHFWRNKRYLNVGDELNSYLISKLSQKKIIKVSNFLEPFLVGIGSILQHSFSEKAYFWGTGIISKEESFKGAGNIIGVRGPLTRDLIKKVPQPPTIGDPALLLPLVYKKSLSKRFEIGFVPHAEDRVALSQNYQKLDNNILVIDVRTNEIEKFIDQILSCELIFSSSLHGLIIAHAYDIPAIWIKLSNNVIGGNFKFYDYFLSVGIKPYKGLNIKNYNLLELKEICLKNYDRNKIQNFDKRKLITSCPIISMQMMSKLLNN